jgi:hypothetical protein
VAQDGKKRISGEGFKEAAVAYFRTIISTSAAESNFEAMHMFRGNMFHRNVDNSEPPPSLQQRYWVCRKGSGH